MPLVTFQPDGKSVTVPEGTPLLQAATEAGVEIVSPCGTKGNCGKCLVRISDGSVEASGVSILSESLRNLGYAQACRSLVGKTPLTIEIPPQHTRSSRFTDVREDFNRIEPELLPRPSELNPFTVTCRLNLPDHSSASDLPDTERITQILRQSWGPDKVSFSLPALKKTAAAIRDEAGIFTLQLSLFPGTARVIDIQPGHTPSDSPGLAIDIGTTTVSVQLVSLPGGEVIDAGTDYNGQISCGLDVISRINFAATPENLERLRSLVLDTINRLIGKVAKASRIQQDKVVNVAISGNTTMIHLLLGLPPEQIRLAPYTPTILEPPVLSAGNIGMAVHPEAPVYIAPAVGSYIGGDITAGLLCTTIDQDSDEIVMFIDIGTNGELAIGNRDFILACACSAGPAFEGGGIRYGMRAAEGAIESVSIDRETGIPSVGIIGDKPAAGICGSGIISLIADLFRTGWLDPAGRLNSEKPSPSIHLEGRQAVYTLSAAEKPEDAIRISESELENIIRAKAAIYSAVCLLLDQAEMSAGDIAKVYIAGGFGHFLNLEDAICIGLLPDIPREKFRYIGNASLMGSTMALVSRNFQKKQQAIGRRITYIELSTDPAYMNQYTAALFLPHTDPSLFPSVQAVK